MGEYAKAEPLAKEALRIDRKIRGPEGPDTAISLNNLALLYAGIGEYWGLSSKWTKCGAPHFAPNPEYNKIQSN
jgi:Tetratricopeptide repeat